VISAASQEKNGFSLDEVLISSAKRCQTSNLYHHPRRASQPATSQRHAQALSTCFTKRRGSGYLRLCWPLPAASRAEKSRAVNALLRSGAMGLVSVPQGGNGHRMKQGLPMVVATSPV